MHLNYSEMKSHSIVVGMYRKKLRAGLIGSNKYIKDMMIDDENDAWNYDNIW